MSDQLKRMSNDEFARYLRRVADDYADQGSESTAEDYREAADRIESIDEDQQGAYEAGVLDATQKREAQ